MQAQLDLIWGEALNIIRQQLNVPTFKTWFENTSPVTIYENTMVISVPNSFAKEWLESRYFRLIKEAVNRAANNDLNIKFIIEGLGDEGLPVNKDVVEENRAFTEYPFGIA